MMTSKPEYMMYAMKTIGNAGYPEFIPDCKSVLEDRSKPQIIRTQAVYSLRKITAFAPEAVSYHYLSLRRVIFILGFSQLE